MKTNDTPQDAGNQNRRGFLKTGAASIAAGLSAGVIAASASGEVTSTENSPAAAKAIQDMMPTRNLGKTGFRVGISKPVITAYLLSVTSEADPRNLSTAKPKARFYAVVPQRFKSWTLPRLLPVRMLDAAIRQSRWDSKSRSQAPEDSHLI